MAADRNPSVAFLDEYRMMVLAPQSTQDVPEFTLFDTLVPRDRPVNSRRFRVPLKYHNRIPSVHVDGSRCLGTLDRDRPLTTDPTQAVLVVELDGPGMSPVLLIVRIQTLIEYVRSTTTDACVSWEVWGRGATVMEVPIHGSAGDGPYPLVQGVHLILVKVYDTAVADGSHLHPLLYAFDCSRRGCSLLPPWDEGGGTERMVSFEDGQKFVLQGREWIFEWDLKPLVDGGFMYLVSRFRRWKNDCTLTLCQDKILRSCGYVVRVGADLSGSIVPPAVTRIGGLCSKLMYP